MSVVRTLTASTSFGASHHLDDHPTCSRPHGHQYLVTLTFSGEPLREWYGQPVSPDEIKTALAVVRELANLNLNEMVPAGPPSVSGVSAYLLERLRILRVTQVEVYESDTNLAGIASLLDR